MCVFCDCRIKDIKIGDGFHVHHNDKENSNYSGAIYECIAVDGTVIVGSSLMAGMTFPKTAIPFLKSKYTFTKVSCEVLAAMKRNLKENT